MRTRWNRTVVLVTLSAAACGGPSEPTRSEPGSPARATLVGTAANGTVGTDIPVTVLVTDSAGVVVANQIMSFVVTGGGGHVFAGAALTSAAGEAREIWTLGPAAGTQTLEARAVDQSTGAPRVLGSFQATATPDVPASIRFPTVTAFSVFVGQPISVSAFLAATTPQALDRFGNVTPSPFVVTGSGPFTVQSDGVRAATAGSGTLNVTAGAATGSLRAVALRDLREGSGRFTFVCGGALVIDTMTYVGVASQPTYTSAVPGPVDHATLTIPLRTTINTYWYASTTPGTPNGTITTTDTLFVVQGADALDLDFHTPGWSWDQPTSAVRQTSDGRSYLTTKTPCDAIEWKIRRAAQLVLDTPSD